MRWLAADIGSVMVLSVAIWYLAEYAPQQCGPSVGTVEINRRVSDYGFGPEKKLIVIELTDIGGADNIPDDVKADVTMSTYINGQINATYNIGVEHKGRGYKMEVYPFKFALGIETRAWDEDKQEWDGTDRCFSELGFTREFEDYVLRRERDDTSMVLDGAMFRAQPQFYEFQFVEVLYLVSGTYTYEGVFYFVNNPAKKDTIPNAVKYKGNPVNETTYIVEYQYDTDDSCNLDKHPHLECKYPKPSKLSSEAKNYLENLLTFTNSENMNWPSLATDFIIHQAMLGIDMQRRSMIYHVQQNKLQGGPIWDAENRDPLWAKHDEWILKHTHSSMTWWKTWLDSFPEFAQAIRNSSALQNYVAAYQQADKQLRSDTKNGYFNREMKRWPCVKMMKTLDNQKKWFTSRTGWMKKQLPSFAPNRVTYVGVKYPIIMWFAVASFIVLGLGLLIVFWDAIK